MTLSSFSKTSSETTKKISKITSGFFNWHSFGILFVVVFLAWAVGRIIGSVMHHLSDMAGRRADSSSNLAIVNRLRRLETVIILVSALIRALLVILGIYVWWALTHPQQLTALLGASALLLLLLSNIVSPIFRDFALGGGMLAEKWFGVGDLVTIQPYAVQGIIDKVTLRSTKIKSLNGETVYVSNQNIGMVQVVPRGVHAVAIELFVSDTEKADKLIAETNQLLPGATSMVITPLTVMHTDQTGENVWHITAIAETAPWRDSLITENAVAIIKALDEKSKDPILLSVPFTRVADSIAEKEFARAIKNSRKSHRSSVRVAAGMKKNNK